MRKKLIAIDLDGTLLHHDNTISDYTKKIIAKVQEKGHQVIISTGRPYRMALDYYLQLNLKTPIITFNGSLTHMPEQKWAFEHNVTLDRKYLFDILKYQNDFQMDFIASEYRKNFYITFSHRDKINPQLFGVEAITDEMMLEEVKITRNPNALLTQTHHQDKYALAKSMRAFFKDEIEIDSWGGPLNILEISPKNINKAYALNYLLGVLNKDKKDLIAFGDEHNDTEMLALAGTGYAMKNASPVLLPFADQQLEFSNEEDGVAKKLEELFL
ncbi:Cof-type HAD-IIB family hydrolase [Streptococcus didelphis]|uniref:Cof-type HAD-IIB family hydrolase n=1 Tax=Streptococcus didelphis TaxID=102886 RepID=A0ABY9LIM2_9STRE|nr:Cof-type HAD-IIB family hydrolase [Streptococcus didelphis]WMB28673.1 Cof-type HAD-IIB family hydrolase [Streptococcus didelphis]WMB29323.1 Cof-type HAD-IIB family hydrolase [Streptococcus didelphis]